MTIAAAWRYPVKSMQGEPVAMLDVEEKGVVGDREYGVVDLATGRVLSAKWEPKLLTARPGDDDGALSAWLGRPVEVRRAEPGTRATYQSRADPLDDTSEMVEWSGPAGSLVDDAPVHLLTTASLRAMGRLAPERQWDERRFRPNLVVDADGDDFVEDGWVGRRLRIGDAELEVIKRTSRCSMVGRAQPAGIDADQELVRALRDHHELKLGVHARVVAGGRIEVGARVELLEG